MLKRLTAYRRACLALTGIISSLIICFFPVVFCTGCRKIPEYMLTVNVLPAEAGTVFREPAGPLYKRGTTVTLTARQETEKHAFSRWSGDLTGTDNPANIVMNAEKNVTAHFLELPYHLRVDTEGEGKVFRKIAAGGDAGPVQIQLTAHPSPGWVFQEWAGDLTGRANPAVFPLDKDKTITALFTDKLCEITGRITYGRAGTAVAGAMVTVFSDEDGTVLAGTETDSEGRYSFLLDPGLKVDLVAGKAGLAGSRFQGIVVSAGESFRADLIMQDPEDPGGDTTPPSLKTNVSPGETISGRRWISVTLEGAYEPRSIYIDIGTEFPFTYPYDYPTAGGAGSSKTLDTTGYPDGPSFINIVAYDGNNNCVTTRIPVIIKNDAPVWNSLVMKKPLRVVAYTQGDDMQIQSDLPQVQGDFSIMAAEERSACYVHLSWEHEFAGDSGFSGYNVYRSSFANGPWRLLGAAYEDTGTGRYYFFDLSADITPGLRSYYKVVPYGPGGEGSGKTGSVVPLGRFEVRLKTPAHGATGIPLNPTLEWEHNGLEADSYNYELSLISLSEEPRREARAQLRTKKKDQTAIVYNHTWEGFFALQNNWAYQWDVTKAEACKLYDYETDGGEVTAIYSAAYSRGRKGDAEGSYNGAFLFITGAAE